MFPFVTFVSSCGEWPLVVGRSSCFGDSLGTVNCVVVDVVPIPSLSPSTSRPSHVNDSSKSSLTLAKRNSWSSLFKSLPKNARAFIPCSFDILDDDDVLVAPSVVLQAGIDY